MRLYRNGGIQQNRENILREVIFFLDVFGPLEEEDKSVDVGLDSVDEVIIVKGIDLLDLDSGSSHTFDQLGEYPRIRFNCAPLIKHFIFKSLYSLKKVGNHIFFTG